MDPSLEFQACSKPTMRGKRFMICFCLLFHVHRAVMRLSRKLSIMSLAYQQSIPSQSHLLEVEMTSWQRLEAVLLREDEQAPVVVLDSKYDIDWQFQQDLDPVPNRKAHT